MMKDHDYSEAELLEELQILRRRVSELESRENFFRSSGFLLQLFDNIGTPIFVKDEDHRWVFMNKAAAEAFGHAREFLLGKSDFDLFPEERASAVWEKDALVLETGMVKVHEEEICRQGRVHVLSTSRSRWIDPKTGKKYLIGITQDITDHKKAEAALRESESRYRAIVEDQTELVSRFLPDGTLTFVNEAYCRFFGETPDELIGHTFWHHVPEADKEPFRRHLSKLGREKPVAPIAHCVTNAAGEVCWQQWTDRAILDAEGNILEIQAVGRDVTRQRQTEEALRENQRMLLTLMSNLPGMAYRCQNDASWTMEFVSDGCLDLTGFAASDLMNNNEVTYAQLIHPEDRPGVWDAVQSAVAAQRPFELTYRITTADGTEKWVWEKGCGVYSLEGDLIALEGFGTDITELKRSEQELQEAFKIREDLEAIIDRSPAIAFLWRAADGWPVEYVSHNVSQLGYTAEDFKSGQVSYADIIHPEDLDRVGAEVATHSSAGVAEFTQEYRVFSKWGDVRWIDDRTWVRRNEDGVVTHFQGIVMDITDRRKMEEEQVRLTTAIEQVPEGIVLTDTAWKTQYVNPAYEHGTGYTREETIGQIPHIFTGSRHRESVCNEIRDAVEQGGVWKGALVLERKDGTPYEVEATISPVRDNSGRIINYVIVKRDVTHEMELEKQLRQAQKMEAIGTLAGGIAHDFNNILAAIIGYTEIASYGTLKESPLWHNLQQVLKAAHRARDLIKQILVFSRQENKQERAPVDVKSIIRDALKMLRASLPATIEIRQIVTCEKAIALADPTQIHQVLINLCTNAAHSMREKGGVLEVSLVDEDLDPAVAQSGAKPRSFLKLTVSDTGHGMDEATMERIFDPYFTTKEAGEGSGLGLAVVLGIVKGHNGVITVRSSPGEGASFHVFLPKAIEVKDKETRPGSSVAGGKECILLVDDEEALVDVGRKMLEYLGYRVVAKTSSLEALEEYRSRPHHFDLVLADYTMPHMTGFDFSKEVLKIRPEMPIILCTGFNEMVTEEKAKALGIRELVMKPLGLQDLAQAIRKVLDGST